jgi:predicted ester cyclase
MAEQIVGIMEGPDLEGLDVRTRAAFLSERRRLLDTFPDLVIVADDVIADGGKVAVRWHVTATHGPSNRRVSFRGMTWLEFDDGRIVRGWDNWNMGALIQSLTSPQ